MCSGIGENTNIAVYLREIKGEPREKKCVKVRNDISFVSKTTAERTKFLASTLVLLFIIVVLFGIFCGFLMSRCLRLNVVPSPGIYFEYLKGKKQPSILDGLYCLSKVVCDV